MSTILDLVARMLQKTRAEIAAALGLPESSDDGLVAQAILDNALAVAQNARAAAQTVVNSAIADRRISEAQRKLYMDAAIKDLAATRIALNSCAPGSAPVMPKRVPAGRRTLTAEEKRVCELLGVTEETFLNANAPDSGMAGLTPDEASVCKQLGITAAQFRAGGSK